MKAQNLQNNNSSLVLRLKILSGYVSLLTLLCIIVFLVWIEHQKMEALKKDESNLYQKREAVNQTFEKLLDFSFSDNFLLLGDSANLYEYQLKRRLVTEALNGLKQYYHSAIQHLQIDKISSLLLEKETLLLGIMNTLSYFSRTDSLLQQKIPIIAIQTSELKRLGVTGLEEKKRGGFLGLFKKKKSVYARQREKHIQSYFFRQTTGKLYSLQREMHQQYTDYTNKLEAYSDSLQQRNTELNSQLSGLIREFERTAVMRTEKEAKEIAALREQSFYIILIIAAVASLLIIVFYFFIHHDIKKRLEYRMKLEVSNRHNKELLSTLRNLILTVSHDLRAPLSTISEYAELLQNEDNMEQHRGYAVNILRASRHVIGLANNLLYYYRLEAEKEQPEKEIFHPGRTVEDTVRSFLPMAEKKGLGLTVEVTDSDVLVEGDSARLIQILNNLLSNAVKYTRSGYIHVSAHYRSEKLCFFVRDTGIGISKDRQERIFTAFERGESPDMEQGFGLGLAITYKLVTLLNGTIHVQSTLGYGSTFEVCLPIQEADGKRGTMEHLPDHGELSGMRVLAIDDDRMQLDVTRKMYARYGVECDCCLNVGELIEALRHNRYDLMLTDIRMSEIDGYGVLALLRGSNLGQTKTLPVLAVTAQASERPEDFRKAGFAGCLYKPFSPEELMSATWGIDRPIFTAIMEGEEDTTELLNMFLEDTEEELTGMQEAFGTGNYERLGHIIHKAAPLWGMIRIGVPLRELEEMATMPPEKWGKALDRQIERLIKAVEQAANRAKELIEKSNENHIDSRR